MQIFLHYYITINKEKYKNISLFLICKTFEIKIRHSLGGIRHSFIEKG